MRSLVSLGFSVGVLHLVDIYESPVGDSAYKVSIDLAVGQLAVAVVLHLFCFNQFVFFHVCD